MVAGSEKKDGIRVSRLENWIWVMLMIGIKNQKGNESIRVGAEGGQELLRELCPV